MRNKLENVIRLVYKEWKTEESRKSKKPHPDPELLLVFSEKPLPCDKSQDIKLHLILCDSCSEFLAAQLSKEIGLTQEIPGELIKWAKGLALYRNNAADLSWISCLKKKVFPKLIAQKFITLLLWRNRQPKKPVVNYR